MDTRDDFHQGGFTRAVLTDECMYFPGADIEIHFIESFDSREVLGDFSAFKYALHFDKLPLKERSRKDPASLCVFDVDLSFQY
jgi:hypothetical protein